MSRAQPICDNANIHGIQVIVHGSFFSSSSCFVAAVRQHWSIENQRHWQLDIAFQEEPLRLRLGHADANFRMLLRTALSLLKNNHTLKVGVKNKRLAADWDDSYLEQVLFGQMLYDAIALHMASCAIQAVLILQCFWHILAPMVVEADEKPGGTDESPSDPVAVVQADRNKKQGNSGCLVLFLLAMPILDAFGMIVSIAGRYAYVVEIVGLASFAFGAVVGAYVSAKITKRPWWKSWWWAVGGLIGMCLPAIIVGLLPCGVP
jgi:hypothetical protein